jgi:hypothetical protein
MSSSSVPFSLLISMYSSVSFLVTSLLIIFWKMSLRPIGLQFLGCDRSPFLGRVIKIASCTCVASVSSSQYAMTDFAIVARASGDKALRASAVICDSPGILLWGSERMTLIMISSAVGVVLRWLRVDLRRSLSVASSMLTGNQDSNFEKTLYRKSNSTVS